MEIDAHSRPRRRGPVRKRTRKPMRRNLEGPPDDEEEEEFEVEIGGGSDRSDE